MKDFRPAPARAGFFFWLSGWLALLVFPWNAGESSFLSFGWMRLWPLDGAAPAIVRILGNGEVWLVPFFVALLAAAPVLRSGARRRDGARMAIAAAAALVWLGIVGGSIGLRGWTWQTPEALFGPLPTWNAGFGAGAWLYGFAMLMLAAQGFAARGALGGNVFVVGLLAVVMAVLAIFVAWPLLTLALGAFQTPRGVFAPESFWPRLSNPRIWRSGGALPNTIMLATASASSATALALAFGLLTERSGMLGRRLLRTFSILPIITPPFVVGLSVILLLGRAGLVNQALEASLGIAPTRWIYGFHGVWFAQTLAFTPIAYLVFVGVLQGVSPALEEAGQTLRASPAYVFRTITLPLVLPGLANAFLVVFAHSLADFGNPLLLGGDFQVLATSIYFAVVGARQDRGFAAVMGLILLALVVVVFLLQRAILSGRSYTTISGKGVGGRHLPLPRSVRWVCMGITMPWVAITVAIYGSILFGGFVENWGLNNTPTLRHYRDAFGFALDGFGLRLTGQAWDPLITTTVLALIAAPLTSALGLCIAYVVGRQDFSGKSALEVSVLMAGAVPGTVLGISYILTFNNPPVELVQTAAIIVISFVIRNMGPGVRAGLAGLSQIDRSLEEASMTLRASGFMTLHRVALPLLRPAILTGLVHGFASAMTTVSAVIFLVSPGLTLATVYIVNLAEAGTYGRAIATSSAMILFMLATILLAEWLIGERRLRPSPARAVGPGVEA